MAETYTRAGPGDEFNDAGEYFEGILHWLDSEEAGSSTHAALEAQLTTDGRELMRQLLQGHLELRALRETPAAAALGSDGVDRTHVRPATERGLMTVFGPVRVIRRGYGSRGEKSLFPNDAALNLPAETHSHGLRLLVAEEAAKTSFDEVAASVTKYTGGTVAKRQAEELAARAATDFDAFYETRTCDGPETSDDLLVLSLDAKGIVMRKEGLREATRRAAEQAKPKLGTRTSPGEKKNRKRMATVAAAYTVEANPRAPEDVMTRLVPVEAPRSRPKARNKRVWASVYKSAEQVTEQLFEEAARRDPERRRTWVMLVDGDEHQLDRVHQYILWYNVSTVVVLDFIHVLEKLWKAAWCLHSKDDKRVEKWVHDRAIAVLKGRSSDVAAGIRRSATRRHIQGEKRRTIDKVANYLLNNRDFLRYDEALAAGYPIATGVIEGACRYLIKDRMDITGARWGLAGAEAVLRLRALRTCGDFDEYWSFHLRSEYERVHLSRYADDALVRVA